jgi:hypothetical protein
MSLDWPDGVSGRNRLAASINQALVDRYEHKDLLHPTIARQDPSFCLTVQSAKTQEAGQQAMPFRVEGMGVM